MSDAFANRDRRAVAIIGTRGYPSYYGGFETAVRRIAPYLADRGWSVTVYGRPRGVKVDDPERDPRVKTETTRGLDWKSLSTLTYGLTSVIHAMRARPDVALVMNVANGFWLPLLRARGIPTVVNVDGIEWERDKWSGLGKAVFKLGAKATARFADRLVFDANAIGRYWRTNFGVDGDFIPYGGDPRSPLPLKDDGLETGRYALMVARFVPENTVGEFLEAAKDIAKTNDVVIVGSSGYGGELDQRAAALADAEPRVRWLGHVNDDDRLHALWQHAGVYFHGHSVGGTNPALVQAMALGAPIVARGTIYNREVLGDDGGLFVEPRPSEIARGVLEVLGSTERQERLRSAVLERSAAQYTWELVCRAYEQSLESAISDARRSPQGRRGR